MPRKRLKTSHCSNCGYDFRIEPQHNNFCPNCGQENHNPRTPFLPFIHGFLETVFHYDNKTFTTLRTLLFRPGTLTTDYLQNKRARYVPPVRMFIFTLAFFILVLYAIDRPPKRAGEPAKDTMSLSEQFDRQADSTYVLLNGPFPWSGRMRLPVHRLRSLKTTGDVGQWIRDNHLPSGLFNRLYFMSYQHMINEPETPARYLKEKNKIKYGAMLLMTPVLAGILLLLFYKKELLFYDVMVFSLHIMTFWMLAGMLVALVQLIVLKPSSDYNIFPILYPASLLTVALCGIPGAKKVFGLSWPSTIVRILLAVAAVLLIWITSWLLIDAFGIL